MPLLGSGNGAAPAANTATGAAPASAATSEATPVAGDAKTKKLAYLEEYKAKKKAAAAAARQNALRLRDELVKDGHFDKLSAESREFIISLGSEQTNGRVRSANAFKGEDILKAMFDGALPKVGARKQVSEALTACLQGKVYVDSLIKKPWNEAGYVIDIEKGATVQTSTYVVTAVPAA